MLIWVSNRKGWPFYGWSKENANKYHIKTVYSSKSSTKKLLIWYLSLKYFSICNLSSEFTLPNSWFSFVKNNGLFMMQWFSNVNHWVIFYANKTASLNFHSGWKGLAIKLRRIGVQIWGSTSRRFSNLWYSSRVEAR